MPELACNLHGPTMQLLVANDSDYGVARPFLWRDGRSYVTRDVYNPSAGRVERKSFPTNTAATLPYDTWKVFDNVVQEVMRQRLKAVADLRQRGLVYNLPNGLSHSLLQFQKGGDLTGAQVSMSPASRSEGDRPETDTGFLPLPLTHKDFDIDYRELQQSKNGFMPLDTYTASLAARKVAEELEKMLIGTVTPFQHGGNYVYGYRTLPERATKTDMTVPTGSNGTTVLADVLALRQLLINDNHYGPYVLYCNRQWSEVLDSDFSTLKGDMTLRQRILSAMNVEDVVILDYLPQTHWECLLVEMLPETVRLVIGFDTRTVEWDSMAGYMKHYKVLAEIVPHIRADTAGNSGVGHGTTVAA